MPEYPDQGVASLTDSSQVGSSPDLVSKMYSSSPPVSSVKKSYQMDHALGHHWLWTWYFSCSSDFVALWFPETKFKAGNLNVNLLWVRLVYAWCATMLIKKTTSVKTYRSTDDDWACWNFKQNLITIRATMWWPCLTIVVGLKILKWKVKILSLFIDNHWHSRLMHLDNILVSKFIGLKQPAWPRKRFCSN